MLLSCSVMSFPCIFFVSPFFFQAEDGIRDGHVTGVQTCALPIFFAISKLIFSQISIFFCFSQCIICITTMISNLNFRSEERRVGKECRSRWWQYHLKKKEDRDIG